MKQVHLLTIALLAGILLLTAHPSWSQDKAAPPDLDGTIWLKSSSAEKRAFLYGAGSAFVLEYSIRMKHNEQPSKFVQGWVDVLKDQTWAELEKTLDAYYANNPDKLKEHVFAVMWNHMIKPNLKN
jgi:hypothetical protein